MIAFLLQSWWPGERGARKVHKKEILVPRRQDGLYLPPNETAQNGERLRQANQKETFSAEAVLLGPRVAVGRRVSAPSPKRRQRRGKWIRVSQEGPCRVQATRYPSTFSSL